MAHAVQFTRHASERLTQRFGATIPVGVNVDISNTFRAVGTLYRHNTTGARIQTFIPKDASVRLVMEVDMDRDCVITVMAHGPVVDAVYRKVTVVH